MPTDGLSVAVTGPTGDLGIALVDALERSRKVKKIVGMARREFDPADQGWKKTEYRQGDVQDKKSVRDAVKGADVVVHLAFAILSASDATRAINIDGSRNVFEAAVETGAERICYASSVAAYGFHDDNPDWLTEDVEPRGTREHFYSQQKAEVESVLGPHADADRAHARVGLPALHRRGPEGADAARGDPVLPHVATRCPTRCARLLGSMPVLKPVMPDPGTPFQLVHEDDVASAFVAGVQGKGSPGPYNLAGNGTLTDERPRRRARLVLGAAAQERGRRRAPT